MEAQLGHYVTAREPEVRENEAAGVSLRRGRDEQEQDRTHTR
jgi:hypothetical protein